MAQMVDAFRAIGHEVIVLGPPVLNTLESGGTFKFVRASKRFLPQVAFELIELLHAIPSYFLLLWTWLRYRPDILYERFSLFQLAGVWLQKTVGIPLILEVNSPLLVERGGVDGLQLKWLAARCERFIMRSADRVLPVSEVLAGMLCDAGVEKRSIEVVHNGIDVTQFVPQADSTAAKEALGLNGQTVIGFTGFVRDWHRLESVLELLAEEPVAKQYRFLIVGDGPGIKSLRERAASLGVAEQVTVTGSVAHDVLPRYLAAFDVAVQPGVTPYASPLKLFEYMAMAKSIVAPDQANIREIVADGESAYLFDPDDAGEFKQHVRTLCEDEGLRSRLGHAALKRLHEKSFFWQDNAHRIGKMANTLLQR